MLSARLSQATKDNDLLEKDILELREKACDFYFSLDKKGLTESVSPSVEDIFGFSQEKIIGKNYFYFVPVANIVQSKRAFEYFSANKQPYRMISDKGMGSDGLENHSELYFTPNFDDKGEFVGYCVLGWIIKKL